MLVYQRIRWSKSGTQWSERFSCVKWNGAQNSWQQRWQEPVSARCRAVGILLWAALSTGPSSEMARITANRRTRRLSRSAAKLFGRVDRFVLIYDDLCWFRSPSYSWLYYIPTGLCHNFVQFSSVSMAVFCWTFRHCMAPLHAPLQTKDGVDVLIYFWNDTANPTFCGWWCGPCLLSFCGQAQQGSISNSPNLPYIYLVFLYIHSINWLKPILREAESKAIFRWKPRPRGLGLKSALSRFGLSTPASASFPKLHLGWLLGKLWGTMKNSLLNK